MAKLSILIPARNEEWLERTVEDLLQNIKGDTEILVGLDGEWPSVGLPDHDRVKILYYPEPIGQRALCNQLARMSSAKYVMKLDAHCAMDKGFDVKLMEDMQDDWTLAPALKHLWVFDWECVNCGNRVFQNPKPKVCEKCGRTADTMIRTIVWLPNPQRPTSTAFLFDPEPHFQYFNDLKRRQAEQGGDLVETMSLQGSCFMMTREKYWSLGVCSEEFGSWGSQGIEVACKTWLSGGKVMVSKKTWYAHLFRTGDMGFPYPNPQDKVNKAKKHAKNLFFGNRWPQQIYPLSWLVEKFWPVTGWTDADLAELKKADGKISKA